LITAGAHAEFEPPGAQRIEHCGVLGYSDRIFERQCDDRGAKPDALGLGGHPRQEHQRRRQTALLGVEMVLCHPPDVIA
jgi:hypothetical protein